MPLTIARAHVDLLKEHGHNCWPEEACALLVGEAVSETEAHVSRIVLSDNIAVNKKRFFEIDPGVRIRLEKELREAKKETIVGIFHSHPNGSAIPSRTDAKMVIERQFFWLIAALEQGQVSDLKVYKPTDTGKFSAVSLNIVNEKQSHV